MNKIDLPSAEPERVAHEIGELIGEQPDGILRISAKTGEGVEDVLEAIVQPHPAAAGRPGGAAAGADLRLGVRPVPGRVAYVRVVDGAFARARRSARCRPARSAEIDEIGFRSPDMVKTETLEAGEVGYIITGIKNVAKLRVGDTLTTEARPASRAAARVQGGAAGRVLRPLPGRHRPVRGPARRAREAVAQRRLAVVRSRDLAGARLRLSLRLPRPAAHGHRARAPGARVRPRAARDDAERRVPRADVERRDARGPQPDRHARPELHRGGRGALHPRDASSRRPSSSGRSWSCARTAAARTSTCTTCPSSGCSCATTCRWPRSCSTSTTS